MIHIYLYGALCCWDIGVGVVNLVKWLGWCNWWCTLLPFRWKCNNIAPNRVNASKFLRL